MFCRYRKSLIFNWENESSLWLLRPKKSKVSPVLKHSNNRRRSFQGFLGRPPGHTLLSSLPLWHNISIAPNSAAGVVRGGAGCGPLTCAPLRPAGQRPTESRDTRQETMSRGGGGSAAEHGQLCFGARVAAPGSDLLPRAAQCLLVS